MPMTLSVGLTKKAGLPNYGSVGASCHIEVELDGSILHGNLEAFHRHVRNAFWSCREAVYQELAQHQPADVSQTLPRTGRNGNGHAAIERAPRRSTRDAPRHATASQVSAIEAIAQRQQIDLATLLGERFHVAAVEDLSVAQASSLRAIHLPSTGVGCSAPSLGCERSGELLRISISIRLPRRSLAALAPFRENCQAWNGPVSA